MTKEQLSGRLIDVKAYGFVLRYKTLMGFEYMENEAWPSVVLGFGL